VLCFPDQAEVFSVVSGVSGVTLISGSAAGAESSGFWEKNQKYTLVKGISGYQKHTLVKGIVKGISINFTQRTTDTHLTNVYSSNFKEKNQKYTLVKDISGYQKHTLVKDISINFTQLTTDTHIHT
jgi:hypothetical protein